MRTLLAENYLKEGMKDNSIEEYTIAADILLNKKDYNRAEQLLLNVLDKLKHAKIFEKLLNCYTAQGNDDKAIDLLSSLGDELYKNATLLKLLGEMYLKKNLMEEAEKVFIKIAEIDPEETEVIMRLGKVYLQREEYDKTFELFRPIVDKNIEANKYEEAASLLRFIIASNNSYLPALTRLASIFKISGKTNNLIALYESLIPIYERKGMKDELKRVLEELIKLSDTPFTYEEQLERMTGKVKKEKEVEEESEREVEFVSFNMRVVDEALKVSDHEKAINTLIKAKVTFPKNIELCKKLFDVYLAMEKTHAAVEEGKGLLELYKEQEMQEEYSILFDQLAALSPEDEKIVEISDEEKTSIDIDFQKDEVAEEIQGLGASDIHEDVKMPAPPQGSGELLVLSEDQSMSGSDAKKQEEFSKSLSAHLSELDFYINDNYFNEAEKLIDSLKKIYSGNKELLVRIDKLKKAKASEGEPAEAEGDFLDLGADMIAEEPAAAQDEDAKVPKEFTEPLLEKDAGPEESEEFVIERSSSREEEINFLKMTELEETGEARLLDEGLPGPEEMPLEVDVEEPMGVGISDIAEIEGLPDVGLPGEDSQAATDKRAAVPVDEPFEIESSISEETHSAQELEDSKLDMKLVGVEPPEEQIKVKDDEFAELEAVDLEIEIDSPSPSEQAEPAQPAKPAKPAEPEAFEIDKDMLIQSPSADPSKSADAIDEHERSGVGEIDLDLDNVMMPEEKAKESSGVDMESPFKDISGSDLAYESDEDLLEGEPLLLEEAYFEIEKNTGGELEAILFWLKEVEKQRTSTIEKNMMEIFDEFKKGVDEKIGHEDYDTRYNLGIAYKEMGLLEEAIHEFLISSKHPAKLFDSAGLLGMCFREKGMFSEATTWFEKALVIPDRKDEEYLAVRFEMVVTYKLKEDYPSAKKVAEDIMRIDMGYRNIMDVYEEIKRNIKP
jgi:tetratricopeptide (TPR) repeat protein